MSKMVYLEGDNHHFQGIRLERFDNKGALIIQFVMLAMMHHSLCWLVATIGVVTMPAMGCGYSYKKSTLSVLFNLILKTLGQVRSSFQGRTQVR